MPLMVSHLAGANKERLKRVSKNSRHSIFGKILCFRKLCRIQSGHTASLHTVKFKKFQRKVARNAKKGLYKNIQIDSTRKQKPAILKAIPVIIDTAYTQPTVSDPVVKPDSLIILGAELLFETNKSTLRSEHFATLNPIVAYLRLHGISGARHVYSDAELQRLVSMTPPNAYVLFNNIPRVSDAQRFLSLLASNIGG